MKFSVEEVARALGAESPASGRIAGWSVDTRSIKPGDLFFALRGPNHDGNEFVEQALGKGAVAAVAEHPAKHPAEGPVVVVPDALAALQQLAHWARGVWGGGVVAVTGSAGKTSTKEIIAEVLSVSMQVGKNEGNLNNHVGVPLSILRLPEETRVAVLEMGMNHAGEIRRLAEIAAPDIGVVTNVGYAHIENFGSVEGIALAKRELIESLGPDGVAVLNADDAHVAAFRDVHPGRTLTFGLSESADVRGEDVKFGEEIASFRVGNARFETSLAGRHAVLNILAGLAVGSLYGIRPEQAVEAVRRLKPGKMRGERFR
ncbi:MAG: UDP-N-acetylmuramoyl-tripeptide--D-alanyl-D-alanine ligase, partial [Bryobacteraceae bacterium]